MSTTSNKESKEQYFVLMHPNSGESYILDESHPTVDEAVKAGAGYDTLDFWVITKVEWEAVKS